MQGRVGSALPGVVTVLGTWPAFLIPSAMGSAWSPISLLERAGVQGSSGSSPGLIPAIVLTDPSLTAFLQGCASVHSPLWFSSAQSSVLD